MKKLLVVLAFMGCTDATMGNFTSLGDPAFIQCFSGGEISYEGHSTGKVMSTDGSDGWQFKEKETGDFIRISGDCVVRN